MKHLLLLTLGILLTLNTIAQQPLKADDVFAKYGEVYFTFQITDATKVHSLTNIISIDNVKGNTVWAYANRKEFAAFKKTGLAYSLLPHPSELIHLDVSDNPKEVLDWNYYPTYEAYENIMFQFAADHPDICKIITIGSLFSGRKILAAKISDNLNTDEDEPKFLYTSTMHGDETTGYPNMLHLIDYLLTNYGSNQRVTNMVNNMEIYINPLANPDGTYHGGNATVNGAIRYNGNSVDLNRNYPDPQDGQHPDGESWQPETVAFMNFASAHHINMSANFHGGYEVVNYPWDTWPRLHADDNWWQYVSREYADTAQANSPSGYMNAENNGITNGYAWYEANGGRQDYMTYFQHGRECTIELSYTKLIPASQLVSYWNYNYRSFLNYMEQSFYGVRGIVTDSVTGQPLRAKVRIIGHDIDSSEVYANLPVGDYHRLIKSGEYVFTFSAPGYITKTIGNVTVSDKNTTWLNVQLYDGSVIPAFTADVTSLPMGGTVHFTDQTYGNPTSWLWAFEGGTPPYSTEQNPSVVYNTPGVYSVSLSAANAGPSHTLIKNDYITVTEDYLMGTSTVTTCSGNFSDPGGTGNYANNIDAVMTFLPADDVKMIKVDFTSFELEADAGCTKHWFRIFDGADTNATLIGTYCVTDSPGSILASHGGLTFQFHSDSENNAMGWTAQIQCDSGVGIEEPVYEWLKVFPNPASGEAVVIESQIPLREVRLINLLGQVERSFDVSGSRFVMPLDNINAGLYTVEVISQKQAVYRQKLIIK
jgi:PKD repeat protein